MDGSAANCGNVGTFCTRRTDKWRYFSQVRGSDPSDAMFLCKARIISAISSISAIQHLPVRACFGRKIAQ